MLTLEVNSNLQTSHVGDPEIKDVPVFVKEMPELLEDTVRNKVKLKFPPLMKFQELNIGVLDDEGKSVFSKDFTVTDEQMELKCSFKPGKYVLRVNSEHALIAEFNIVKVRPE